MVSQDRLSISPTCEVNPTNCVPHWNCTSVPCPHHQAALNANPRQPVFRAFYRNNLRGMSRMLVKLSDHADAARRAEEFAQIGVEPALDCYVAACLLSLCAPLATKDTKLPETKRTALAKQYADRAIELLRQAVTKGWNDAAHMKKDPDLDRLRQRDDFKKLLAELEKKPPVK
jgi:hypothetical protein